MSHVPHVNESRHTCGCVVLHMTHTDYSCCTHGRIMPHMLHMDESCRTHSFIMSHTCMNLVAHMHDACVPVFIDAEID